MSDFDIRDLGAPGKADQLIVEQRNAALQSFIASPLGALSGTRIVANRYGLPKVFRREGQSLTAPSTLKAADIGRAFLKSQAGIFLLSSAEVNRLRVIGQDDTGHAVFLALNQTFNGIDVFNGQIKFTLSREGEIVQVSAGDIVPGLNLSTAPGLSPATAVQAALAGIGIVSQTALPASSEPSGRTAFVNPRGGAYSPITSELTIFPMTVTTARLAYRIFIEADIDAFYELVIDADTGALLFRHNLYTFSGQARVWTQSPLVGTRDLVSFPEASTTSPAGWLASTAVVTTGNNVDAYLDATGDDNPDPLNDTNFQNGRAYSESQVFDFPFGDGTTQQDPRLYKPAAVTNLFYLVNMAHDYYYSLGFNEVAGNFQTDNFGRGGLGNDAVRAEAQFGAFKNDAMFSSTPEGIAPKVRMGLFTGGTSSFADDLDPDFDGQALIHEYGHGVSNRLVGGRTSTSCLVGIQSEAMGEGWSDYFAISYYNDPVMSAYLSSNTTHGLRRQSYEGYTFTYEDIGTGEDGYEPHDDGEIWAATLWDLRKSLGAAVTDRLVMDGLKATPCNPSMTDARDAILSADLAANSGANSTIIWTVFARHGLGYSALGVDGTVLSGTRYDAAYDLPPQQTLQNLSITSDPLSLITGFGDPYRYSITASNPAGDALHYDLTSGPSGMTVDSTGYVSWTATFTAQRVKITVTDGHGGKVVHGYLLPILTILHNNTPLNIAGPLDSEGFAAFIVPPDTPIFQATLRGGTGDTDMYIIGPDGTVAFSERDGTSETLSFANPKSGLWVIEVDGYQAYSGVSFMASLLAPTPLGANTSLTSLNNETSSEVFYKVTVPADSTQLKVSTSGGSGDVDLFLRKGAPATCQATVSVVVPCAADYDSVHTGTAESIIVNNPAAADWYIDVQAYRAYSGVRFDIQTTFPPVTISLTGGGSAVTTTAETSDTITTGYATASVSSGTPPYATAVFSLTQNGFVVSEAGIPSSPPTQSARIFIDYRTDVPSGSGVIQVFTGLALANRGDASASMTYTLRDLSGKTIATGHGTLGAGEHQSKMLQEFAQIAPDFNLPPSFPSSIQRGSLEISSTQPVSVLALRLTINQRGDVLLTSTPVADLAKPLSSGPAYFPQLVDGGGYTTSVVLLNTTGAAESGTISVLADQGSPFSLGTVGGTTGSTFNYTIPPDGAFVFQTDGGTPVTQAGWVKVTPITGSTSPVGAGIFSYTRDGILLTESGVPSAAPTTHARVYVDKSNGHDTGLAVATPGSAATITVKAFEKDGITSAGNGDATLNVKANGHGAAYIGEMISGLPDSFTGVAELTSSTPFVALTLRALTNGRGDYLLTTFPIADANQPAPAPIVFPHIAAGGGYTTQFIFISAAGDGSVELRFVGEDGTPTSIRHNP